MKLTATVAAIEFEGDEVRVAVVKTGGKYPSVLELHAARAKYGNAEQRIEALTATTQELVKRVKARPGAWVLCVSCEHGIVRNLTVPTRVRRRGASAIQFELEPFLAVPIDELAIDFNLIRDANGESDVLAVGVRTALLEQYIAILNAAGVDPEGIDVDAAGFTALWQAGRRLNAGLRVALHVRDSGSILVIMHQRAIAYFRHVPITAAAMRENPRAAARQAQNSIRAFVANWKGDDTVEELTVTGVDLFAEERQAFEDAVHVPVTYEDLLRNVKGKGLSQRNERPGLAAVDAEPEAAQEPSWDEPGAAAASDTSTPTWPPDEAPVAAPIANAPGANYWEAVIGAATAAAGGVPAFNFRTGALAQKNMWGGVIRHVAFSAILTVVALAAYGAYCYFDYRNNVTEINRIGEQIWDMYVEAFPDSPRAKEGRNPADAGGAATLAAMQEEVEGMETGDDAEILDLLARPTLLDLLLEIGQKLPPSTVKITELRIRKADDERQLVTISGNVEDSGAFNKAVEDLKQSSVLQVGSEPTRAMKGGKETFAIAASM